MKSQLNTFSSLTESTYNNWVGIILKYAFILALSAFLFKLCSLYLLVYPSHIYGVLSLVVLVCVLMGILFANRNKALTLEYERINPRTVLSRREYQVFELLLSEMSNKEICELLFIEQSTLKTHINKVYKKLEVSQRKELRSAFLQNKA